MGRTTPTHDAFRRLPGSFRSALAGAQALRAEGVPLQINVTVARHNADQLDEMVSLAKKLGAVALHLFLLVPVGCGMEIAEEQTLRADAYEDTLNWLYETERREPDLQLRATCAPHYFRVVRQRQAAAGGWGRPVSRRAAWPPGLGRQWRGARSAPRCHSRMPGRDWSLFCLAYGQGLWLWIHADRSGRPAASRSRRDMADQRVVCRAAGPEAGSKANADAAGLA